MNPLFHPLFLALADARTLANNVGPVSSSSAMMFTDFMLILGAVVLVSSLLFIWAIYFRKNAKPRRKHHRHQNSTEKPQNEVSSVSRDDESRESADADPEDGERSSNARHHGRRRMRRNHRHRNPTLAETGGLPPVRPPGPPSTHA